ncbi:hypothetical protein L2734_03515 [Parashewanella spongiae]|uniref:hypothetical protein n=1 Tax=Parashewanella spongiae TaxID=342950 RepID=UPI001059CC89|nr:hypothetical protein [Parashewanella spongiae]MCL1077253.1 hypothetical protein [Parashewanella spongiae]
MAYRGFTNLVFAYTVVNQSTNKAVFINVMRFYESEPGLTIDKIIPRVMTTEDEMHDDYLLSRFVIRNTGQSSTYDSVVNGNNETSINSWFNNDPEVIEVTLNTTISDVMVTQSHTGLGMASIAGQISTALKSHVSSGAWAKLAGRTVLIVNFDDGRLASFFVNIYVTEPYVYLEGTAVDLNGEPISVNFSGNPSNGSGSGGTGGSGGSGLTGSGSGSWIINGSGGSSGGGSILACVSIDGGEPECTIVHT